MTIPLGRFGCWQMLRNTTPEMAREVEALGYGAIWVGGSPPGDLVEVEALLDATERIPVVTGIVNMWREEAEIVASAYHRVAANHPDRFLLGVGIGHREATEEYRNPLAKIGDYLGRLDSAGVPRDRMVLAALGPKALRIAAERTAGAHPYLTTPAHTVFAREVMGEGVLLAPEHKVMLETDPDRTVARKMVSNYLGRVNYRNNLLRSGWAETDLDNGGSDALVDALVLHGAPDLVASGLEAHLDAGADHVGVHVLGDDPMPAYLRLAEVLPFMTFGAAPDTSVPTRNEWDRG
jgi:probable F420-dependent oxidoreductase